MVRELCTYSTHTRLGDQEEGSRNTMEWRAIPRSWFILIPCPLGWGWNPVDKLAVAHNRLQNPLQKAEVNCGPLCETTSAGIPHRRTTSLQSPWRKVALGEEQSETLHWSSLPWWGWLCNCWKKAVQWQNPWQFETKDGEACWSMVWSLVLTANSGSPLRNPTCLLPEMATRNITGGDHKFSWMACNPGRMSPFQYFRA